MGFKENLSALPEVQGVRLALSSEHGEPVAIIENGPGTAGSFRVYAFLAAKYGAINTAAAREGLEIYAEHTEDARLSRGKHPNIDRLFEVVSTGDSYRVLIE